MRLHFCKALIGSTKTATLRQTLLFRLTRIRPPPDSDLKSAFSGQNGGLNHQGRILAVWILAMKLPDFDLTFAVDFWVDFFLRLYPRKKARKNPPKNPLQNSPGTLIGKIPLGFLQKPFLEKASGPNRVRGRGWEGRVQRGRSDWEGSVAPPESLDVRPSFCGFGNLSPI